MALVPLNLFATHDGKSKRQHITCVYKCGDACSKPVPNRSDNEYFGDVVKSLSRRSMLQAGGVAVLAVGAGSLPMQLFINLLASMNRTPGSGREGGCLKFKTRFGNGNVIQRSQTLSTRAQ